MSELSVGDKLAVATLNQKMVLVQAAAPATAYDGQVWVCTSSDPPLVKTYDATNTNWLQHGEARYETVNSGQLPASGVYLNGALCVAYDTQQSGTKLYAYANGSWRNMGGTLVRAYPIGDTNGFHLNSGGASSLPVGLQVTGASGETIVICSTNVTPSNSGDYVVAFVGGRIIPQSTNSGILRLYIGTTLVGQNNINVGAGAGVIKTVFSLASGIVVSNTSTNVYASIYCTQSGAFDVVGVGLAAVAVKT